MSLNGHRSVVLSFGGAILLSALLFVTFLTPRNSMDSSGKSPTLGDLMSSQDPFDRVVSEVTVMALAGQVAGLLSSPRHKPGGRGEDLKGITYICSRSRAPRFL